MPAQGTRELFVHVSAFPRDGVRPRVGEIVSFETEVGPQGKPRAARIRRPASADAGSAPRWDRAGSRTQRPPSSPTRSSYRGVVFALVCVLAAAAWWQAEWASPRSTPVQPAATLMDTSKARPVPRDTGAFNCDGRRHCSQMTSCAEARHFIRHCPNTEMDGDGDGIPCEDQWCGH
jgi:cold shock CspA family protein